MNELSLNHNSCIMLNNYPDVLSLEQMCEILHICTKTGSRLIKEKKILSLRIGRTYRIPKVHILAYLQNVSH